MSSSFWFDTINLGEYIKHIYGVSDYILQKSFILLSEDLFYPYKQYRPDEMQLYAGFHLGLHCL